MLKVKFKKIYPDAVVPTYAHPGDAGFDLYSIEDCPLNSSETKLINTGLKIEIPKGYEVQIRPRSGLALKHGVTILNAPGTIDSGYRGLIGILLINHSNETYKIKKGERIAQGVINKVEEAVLEEVNELSDSSRGEGGFGSTGI